MRRILCLLVALCMVMGMAVSVTAENDLPYVELDWYVLESPLPGNQEVFDAINEYLIEKINAKINFHFIDATEYSQKMVPILTTGTGYDIVNVNGQLNFVEWAKKGAFAPMDELLEYAPKTAELVGEDFFEAMKIDGSIYAIPSVKDSVQMYSARFNKTLLDEIGVEIPETITDYRSIIPLLEEAYEARDAVYPELKEQGIPITRNYPEIDKWVQFEKLNSLIGVNVAGVPGMSEYAEDGSEVFSIYQTEEYRDMCRTIGRLRTAGVYYNQGDVWYFDPDRVFTQYYALFDIGSGWVECAQYADDPLQKRFESAMVPYEFNVATTNYLHQAANAINAKSPNKERAMMALELINTDEFVATALRFGIEGTHWTLNEDGTINTEGTLNQNNDNHFYWYGAQFGALIYSKVPASKGSPEFMEKLQAANEKGMPGNMGFIFDPTPVQNEIAACSAVIDEYNVNLRFGKLEEADIEGELEAFSAKLDAAGIAVVVEEAQRQLDAFRAGK
ncbi:MAG: ABC transporter substrate-binding protein [Clostridia bacterium]|nr:ABC transporter substrate-binding protein [Clostridia bacterium]